MPVVRRRALVGVPPRRLIRYDPPLRAVVVVTVIGQSRGLTGNPLEQLRFVQRSSPRRSREAVLQPTPRLFLFGVA